MFHARVVCAEQKGARMVPRTVPWVRLGVLFLFVLLLANCPEPLMTGDQAVSNIDVGTPEAPQNVTAASMFNLDNVVRWTWEGAEGSTEPALFRWRINGGTWVGPVRYAELSPILLYDQNGDPKPEYLDHPGRVLGAAGVKVLDRGTYQLEVQQRNAVGTWSDAVTSVVQVTTTATEPVVPPEIDPRLIAYFPFDGSFDDQMGNWLAQPNAVFEGIVPYFAEHSPRENGGSYLYLHNPPEAPFGYVRITDLAEQPVALGEAFTISMWVQPGYVDIYGYYFGGGTLLSTIDPFAEPGTPGYGGMSLVWIEDYDYGFAEGWYTLGALVFLPDEPEPFFLGGEGYSDGPGWKHVAVVVDPATQRLSTYVNGFIMSQDYLPYNFPFDTVPLLLGCMVDDAEMGRYPFPPFFGAVDDLRFFNAALSGEEIAQLAAVDYEEPPSLPDDHGDSFESATPIPLGVSVSGSIDYPGDVDFFRVVTNDAGFLTAYTTYPPGFETDTYGYLYDSWGNLLYESDYYVDLNFRIETTILGPGEYFIAVRYYPGAQLGVGPYELQVDFEPGLW